MNKNINIGSKIREYRTQKGLSIKEIADITNVSSSMLSQIERDLANPSINTLREIANALEIPMFQFFVEDNNLSNIVVTPETRRKIVSKEENHGLLYELLIPDLQGDIGFYRMVLEPGTSTVDTSMNHDGEEVAYVIKGKITLIAGNSQFSLNEKDSVRIPKKVDHRWINDSNELAEVIFAINPPIF